MRHLLQGHARLVQLAEQRVDPQQVAVLVLQLLVRQRRADATADDQQGHDGDRQAQLQMVVFTRLGQQAAVWQDQGEGGHAGEMQGEDACSQHQAAAAFEQLIEQSLTRAQIAGQQQRRQTGADGDHDRKDEQPRMVISRRLRTHGGHAHVMHGGDAQADDDRRLAALAEIQGGQAEGVHRQP
ncbi:hypothetical protein D3C76_716310 [compost metagenome]